MTEKNTFNFTPDFENLLLSCLIKESEGFISYISLIKPTYFSTVEAGFVCKIITNYVSERNRVPSWQVLGKMLADEYSKLNRSEDDALEYVSTLKETQTLDWEYVRECVVKFCREKAVIGAIQSTLKLTSQGKMEDGGVIELFEQALSVGQNIDDLGYLLHCDEVDRVVDKVLAPDFGVKTGIPQFDKVWRNGWAPGWLIVPVAPPKRYKSMWCVNLALSMAGPAVGADVLYYSCELSQEQSFLRSLCGACGLTESEMYNDPELFKSNAKAKLSEMICGNIIVKHFPIGSATVGGDLRAHAKTIMKQCGLKPKAIVIDYADTVNPLKKSSDKEYINQGQIYKEAIALGTEIGACVIMPDRCTKEAVDKKVPDMKAFQGGFAKGGILDIAFGLCMTPAEYSQNILRTFNFINRHGKGFGYWRGKVDPERCQVDIGEEIDYNPDEEEDEKKQKFNSNKRGNTLDELLE